MLKSDCGKLSPCLQKKRKQAATSPQPLSKALYVSRNMRLASSEIDYWELRSGVDSHKENPDKFWIPDEEKRKNLKVGDAAKLIFDIVVVNKIWPQF